MFPTCKEIYWTPFKGVIMVMPETGEYCENDYLASSQTSELFHKALELVDDFLSQICSNNNNNKNPSI
jgi:hypothetical protein